MMAGMKIIFCSLPHQEPIEFMAFASQQRNDLTIRSAVVGDPTVFKFHSGISEGAMLGDTSSHPHTPHAE